MAKRISLLVSALFLTGLFLSSCEKKPPPFDCTDPIGCVDLAPGDPLKLGLLVDMSGGAIDYGLDQARGTEIALSSRDGILLGHPLVLQREDSRCSPEGGRVAASKFVTDRQTVALLGTTCSSSAATASRVMSEGGLVMISGVNSASSLTSITGRKGADWQPGYFRTSNSNVGMGHLAAIFAFRKLGLTRVATINDNDPYTKGLTETFARTFTESGGKIVFDGMVDKGDSDMKPVLTAIVASRAQLVFLPLFQAEALSVVRQAKEFSELKDTPLMGAGSLVTPSFVRAVGEEGRSMFFSRQAGPSGPASDRLRAEFLRRFGEPPRTHAYGVSHDAALLLLSAIEKSALREKDDSVQVGRQALRDAIYSTSDFEGVSGRLDCDAFGDCGVAHYNIVRLDDPAKGVEGLEENVIYSLQEHLE